MNAVEHLRELDDPAKPHRRVWRCASGVHVKTHAVAKDVGFGRVHLTFTGSHCDEAGRTLAHGDGYAIHPDAHELVLNGDGDMTPDARAEYVREQYEAALLVAVRRVEAAVLNMAAAENVQPAALVAAGSERPGE